MVCVVICKVVNKKTLWWGWGEYWPMVFWKMPVYIFMWEVCENV